MSWHSELLVAAALLFANERLEVRPGEWVTFPLPSRSPDDRAQLWQRCRDPRLQQRGVDYPPPRRMGQESL